MSEHTLWVEKYRPIKLENYIGNEHIKKALEKFIENQDIPHCLFFGSAGTGKTTIAKLLGKNIDCDFKLINASDERGIDTIRESVREFAVLSGFAPLKIMVLDECDSLTAEAQKALKFVMEEHSKTTRFILTCNQIEMIIDPIVSRCKGGLFELSPPSKKEVALHMIKILEKENVTFDKSILATLVNTYYPDIRGILHLLQLQTYNGKLELNVDDIIKSNYKMRILDILMGNLPFEDKIKEIRQIIVDTGVRDFTELYRLLFEKVSDYAPTKVAKVIPIIGRGLFESTTIPDKEICFVSTLYNILNS